MAIVYPAYPNIPQSVNPLSAGLSGLMEGWEAGRQQLKEKQGVDAFGRYLDTTGGTATMSLSALGGAGQGPRRQATARPETRTPASIPAGQRAAYIRDGLIKRGLPEHVADGFLVNFQDESGLDPGINERNPTVPGSRGGFGLYQLTGPRRRMYESFARDRGVAPSDIDAQLDFLKFELGGPEAKAASAIMASKDQAGAAQAIVSNFLRPAPEHQQARSARYAGLGGGVQVASADGAGPSAETMSALMDGASGAGATPANDPFPQFTPQQPARQMLPDRETMLELFRNPDTRSLAIDIARRAQAGSAPAETYSTIERADGSVWQMNNLTGQLNRVGDARALERGVTVGNDIVDPTNGRVIYDGPDDAPKPVAVGGALVDPSTGREIYRAPEARPKTQQEAEERAALADQYGLSGDEKRNFVLTGKLPNDGNGVTYTAPDGSVVQVGGAAKPLTEGQGKDAVYVTRATGALGILDQYAGALTDRGDRALGAVPMGIGRGYQNTEFQLAQQAGDEFLQAILRKDTGAAITEQEQSLYGTTYLPQPGDSPELLKQKQQSRTRAVEAIRSGMPPAAIVASELALRRTGAQADRVQIVPGSDAGADAATEPGMPEGMDPAMWGVMTPEEKRLWQN